MDAKQKQKLEKYLKNSSRFLWGLGPGNQKENYQWLREKTFKFDSRTYRHVTNQLLENYGIEQLLKTLIIPRVRELFTNKAIDFLRDCWQAGIIPDVSFVKLYNIRNAVPFLEVNSQFDYVERWGELAGVWFEEIEGLQGALDTEE